MKANWKKRFHCCLEEIANRPIIINNLAFLNEDTEAVIYSYLFDCIIGTMEGVADKMWAESVAEEREAQRQLEDSSSGPQ